MSKLFSSKQVVAVLLREGFVFISQKGSHGKYRKIDARGAIVVIVPMNKLEIPKGTMRSIIKQSQLSARRFWRA